MKYDKHIQWGHNMISVLVTMRSGEKLSTVWDVTLEEAEKLIQGSSHIRFALENGAAIGATSEMAIIVLGVVDGGHGSSET